METRKAQKEHKCTLCNLTIYKGEEYCFKRVTPWDHVVNEHFFDYKAHIECNKIWQEHGSEFNWEFPDNWDEFLEYVL